MKVNTVDNQNFNGNFIFANSFSHSNWHNTQNAIWFFRRRGSFKLNKQPFDIYVRETRNKNIILSLDKKSKNGYLIKRNDIKDTYNFENICFELKNDADKGIKKSSIKNRILYALRLKKYNG